MLEEYLHSTDPSMKTEWHSVIEGVQVCRFTLGQPKADFPIVLTPQLKADHFETLFCSNGGMVLGRRQGNPITIGRHDILLTSDVKALEYLRISTPLEGIMVAIDNRKAKESLGVLSQLLGNPEVYGSRMKELMRERKGCALIRGISWSQNGFAILKDLPEEQQGRYCILKVVELLFLLSSHSAVLEGVADVESPNSYLIRTVADMREYMMSHLDEKLTINIMSRNFHISPTAFKSYFRSLYGQPVHSWLLSQRMEQAAKFLYSTPMTVLQIAQAVGYEGVSQFNVAFKRHFGVTPRQYRKMSDSGDMGLIP